MKNKKKPFFIAASKSAAIFTAKQGLKLNDKTLRLKNVRVFELITSYEGKRIPTVKVVADTDMQTGAKMYVGYSKEHCNIPKPMNWTDTKENSLADRAGITGTPEKSGVAKLLRKPLMNKKPVEYSGTQRVSKIVPGVVLYRISDMSRLVVYKQINERAKLIYVVWPDNKKGSISLFYVERGVYKIDKELGL